MTKTVLILANSRKLSGRCIAGIEIVDEVPDAWVRPVSSREHGEVSEYERRYQDGSDPKVLDLVDIPLLHPVPEGYQTENWLLDPGFYWERIRAVRVDELAMLEDTEQLWLIDTSSTYHGLNDRVPLDAADSLVDSLRLIHVADLEYRVFAPGEGFGDSKRRVQALFTHRSVGYRLRVTDPVVEREYLAQPDATYEVGPAYLTVSLGEPFSGYAYKLIAAVIPG